MNGTAESILSTMMVGIGIGAVIWLAVYVWYALMLSRVFVQLGVEGWKAWVPILNEATILQLGGKPAWNVVFYFIPIVQLYGLYLRILAVHHINGLYRRGTGSTVLAMLLPPVWATILASGPAPDSDGARLAGLRQMTPTGDAGQGYLAPPIVPPSGGAGAPAAPAGYGQPPVPQYGAAPPAPSFAPPQQPGQPYAPAQPAAPAAPAAPGQVYPPQGYPAQPASSFGPPQPAAPAQPYAPAQPVAQESPFAPAQPVPPMPAAPAAPAAPAMPADAFAPPAPAAPVAPAAPAYPPVPPMPPLPGAQLPEAPTAPAAPVDPPAPVGPVTQAMPIAAVAPPAPALPEAAPAAPAPATPPTPDSAAPLAPPSITPPPAVADSAPQTPGLGDPSAPPAGIRPAPIPVSLPVPAAQVPVPVPEPEVEGPLDGDLERTVIAPRPGAEDLESTVVVPRRRSARRVLVLDDGRRFALSATSIVIGRNPDGASDEQRLAVPDKTRTLSKTHARLIVQGDEWRLTDLDSTNGVIVVADDGAETLLDPGETVIGAGRFILGEVGMHVEVEIAS